MKLSIIATNLLIKIDVTNPFDMAYALNSTINKYCMEKLKKKKYENRNRLR